MVTLTKKETKKMNKVLKSIPNKKYEDLEFYKNLRDELMFQFKDSQYVKVDEISMSHQTDYFYYSNNSTCIGVGPAYLRFGSRAKSIDISRVDVETEHQGKGVGTVVMDIFLTALYVTITKLEDKSNIPNIILECCGSCGYGENVKETPIHKQVKFFSKFGFEVQRHDQYGYVHMKLSPEKLLNYLKNFFEREKLIQNNLVTS
jgi:GNAT superfamily N-acetyltransferase